MREIRTARRASSQRRRRFCLGLLWRGTATSFCRSCRNFLRSTRQLLAGGKSSSCGAASQSFFARSGDRCICSTSRARHRARCARLPPIRSFPGSPSGSAKACGAFCSGRARCAARCRFRLRDSAAAPNPFRADRAGQGREFYRNGRFRKLSSASSKRRSSGLSSSEGTSTKTSSSFLRR